MKKNRIKISFNNRHDSFICITICCSISNRNMVPPFHGLWLVNNGIHNDWDCLPSIFNISLHNKLDLSNRLDEL
ncbi:MAG: hypothetical protein ACTSUN_03885 [Promethearchaeota archaeon]